MIIRNIDAISDLLKDQIFYDIKLEDDSSFIASDYVLYTKCMVNTPIVDVANKFALIMIEKDTNYVVNNDLRYNSLEVNGDEFIFRVVNNNKPNKVINIIYYKYDKK